MRARSLFVLVGSLVVMGACQPENPGTPDGSIARADGGEQCTVDGDCDDGAHCNGVERCVVLAAGGRCERGAPPCGSDPCDEVADECRCDGDGDADGDGVASIACGGSDCDDDDVRRYPGNPEICDAAGHDEDCDDTTLGRDGDLDGFVSDACCNGTLCGTDCDDARGGVNTGATEGCNGLDDDCDGLVDESTQQRFYRDLDGDGFGVDGDSVLDCAAPSGYAVLSGDCAPMLAAIHPGAADGPPVACDEVDNDCSGAADEGCECVEGTSDPCGPRDAGGALVTTGICRSGVQTCTGGVVGLCVGSVDRAPETCEGTDQDCDGTTDEGLTIGCWPDNDDDGYALASATVRAVCPDPARTAVGSCPSMTTNRSPTTSADCNDGDDRRSPGRSELCANGVDDDCDLATDEGCTCASCPCSGASLSPTVRLSISDRGGGVVHAGYLFQYSSTGPMGQAILDVACANSPTRVYATNYTVPLAFAAPLVAGENNHEIYMRTVAAGCCGATIDVFIIRQ